MKFQDREAFASYLLNRVITHEMGFIQRMKAGIIVGLYCQQLPEGKTITVT